MSRTPEQMQQWKDEWAGQICRALVKCPKLCEDDIAFALRVSRSTARRLLEYAMDRTGSRDIPHLAERCRTGDILTFRSGPVTLPTRWAMVVNRRNDLVRIQEQISEQRELVRRNAARMQKRTTLR